VAEIEAVLVRLASKVRVGVPSKLTAKLSEAEADGEADTEAEALKE
jgi:hypothetical protein